MLAVDPAELDPEVLKMPSVQHIRFKLQDPDAPPRVDGAAAEDVDALAAIRKATVGHHAPSFVCCDINQVRTFISLCLCVCLCARVCVRVCVVCVSPHVHTFSCLLVMRHRPRLLRHPPVFSTVLYTE